MPIPGGTVTDVLDHRAPEPAVAPDAIAAAPVRPSGQGSTFALSSPGRWLLASLAASAGAVHFAMVPSHMESSTVEGVGFAVAGWIQIVTALLLVVRPSRGLLRFAMATSAVFVGVWAVSRTWGLPVGEHAGHPHDASFVDLVAVGLEIALIVLAGVWLSRPAWGSGWSRNAVVAWSVVPIAVVGLGTAAIASPSARNHAHGSHGVGADGSAAGVAADGHVHGGATTVAAADDKGLSKLHNGHQHSTAAEVDLDAATQTALSQQLNQFSALVTRYPNIAAAEAAGYRRAGPFSPGLGTHYGLMGKRVPEDIIQGVDGPMTPMLIFDGLAPDAPLAGFMVTSMVGSAENPPEGFVGPNDHWHTHSNVCIVFKDGVIEAPLGADRTVSVSECAAVRGRLIAVTTSMVHVWTVPGYESPTGVFAEINPKITCPDGTYFAVKRTKEANFNTNRCRNGAS